MIRYHLPANFNNRRLTPCAARGSTLGPDELTRFGSRGGHTARLVYLVFVAALVLRAGWVLYRWKTVGPDFAYDDEHLHWQLATNLVRDGAMVSDDGRYAARMPVYPLFLALFAWLGSSGILVARLAQAILGALTAALGSRLVDAAAGRRAAIVAGVLLCFDPFAVFFANLLLTEVIFTLLLIALLACVWRVSIGSPRAWGAWLGLLVLGPLAVMTRPSVAALLPLLWLLVVVLSKARWCMLARVAWCPIILVTLMLPWGLRNRAVIGAPAWLSTNGGVTLYDAQGPQADGSSNQEFLRQTPELADLDEVALDRALQRLAVQHMRADPGRVIRLAGKKFLRTWSPTPNVAEFNSGAAALASAVYSIPVIAGAIVALTLAFARRRPDTVRGHRTLLVLVWLPVLYFTLVHCVYIGSLRYRIPLMPCLAIATACAFADRDQSRRNLSLDANTPAAPPPADA